MQQGVFLEILRRADRMVPMRSAGAQTGKTSSLNSKVSTSRRIRRFPNGSARQHCSLQGVLRRIGVEQHVDIRMERLKFADAADEPGRGK